MHHPANCLIRFANTYFGVDVTIIMRSVCVCVHTHMLLLARNSKRVADECTPQHSLFWQFFLEYVPISLPKTIT